MKILKNAVAGTLESSDLFIQVEPEDTELILEIDSVVANQYMDAIRGKYGGQAIAYGAADPALGRISLPDKDSDEKRG